MSQESFKHRSTTSTGHALGDAAYLDARFSAARSEYEAMLRWVGIEKSSRVLDAGCGSGAYLPLLCELVDESGAVTALDLAPENVAACQNRIRALKPACRVETEVGSILRLPFGEGQFDAVWCANTFQYLSDAELSTAVSEFQRVTRGGGIVAMKDGDITCFQCALIEPTAMWRFLEVAHKTVRQFAGLMRALDVPHWFGLAGLVNIRARTYIIERRGLLDPIGRVALRELLEFVVDAALRLNLPTNDLDQWRLLEERLRDRSLLDDPEFFVREGAVVVVGEAPPPESSVSSVGH